MTAPQSHDAGGGRALDLRSLAPGAVVAHPDPVPLAPGRSRMRIRVVNAGDRPVQVGSHVHFPAANDALLFDRDAAWGFRLDVPAGTSVRFEPGVDVEVGLVALGGAQLVPGLRRGRGGDVSGRRAQTTEDQEEQ